MYLYLQIETMEVAPGVTVKEGGRLKQGPSRVLHVFIYFMVTNRTSIFFFFFSGRRISLCNVLLITLHCISTCSINILPFVFFLQRPVSLVQTFHVTVC